MATEPQAPIGVSNSDPTAATSLETGGLRVDTDLHEDKVWFTLSLGLAILSDSVASFVPTWLQPHLVLDLDNTLVHVYVYGLPAERRAQFQVRVASLLSASLNASLF